jgi:DNA-binding Lrp family transcriptional regulator
MDAVDRRIIAGLQGGFPLSHRPYAEAALKLGLSEAEIIDRLGRLLEAGVLSRFGPLFNVEAMGGTYVLAAMSVPADVFETVTQQVNAHVEVAHNYEREHLLNMWFVVAAETPERAAAVLDEIHSETGLDVLAMPKLDEFFVELKLAP